MEMTEELVRLTPTSHPEKASNGNGVINGCFLKSSRTHSSNRGRRARLVAKDGKTMLQLVQLHNKIQNDIRNWFHLLIECSWRHVVVIFATGYLGTWLFFALYYYFIVVGYAYLGKKEKCIENVGNFTTAFLFSMESQHTIGYGTRHMTEACPLAYIGLTCQLIIGVFIQTMVGGLIIAKVLRPKKRKQEMRFSKFAVIGPIDAQDRRPALHIRLADVQEKLFLAESHVRLYMANTRVNENGERVLFGVKDMNVGYDSGWDRVLLLWPIVVRHVIDEHSPLHGFTRQNIQQQDFELIMTVEGIVEATGMTFQARTSFLPEEIVWGERFKPMVILNERKSEYEIQYNLFDMTDKFSEWLAELEAAGGEAPADEEEQHDYNNASGFL